MTYINASRRPPNQLISLNGTHERELTKTCRTGSGSGQGFDDKRLRPMGDLDA
ncbi:hypothetical protein [Bradyrhizobium sp.]|uniref:hypothetical protein n=1 Tax=Bradyrhizobium sp. TaxID=376 RepID=UPI00271B07FA|nr:hypothetical protein [Bradyrhizobium sp.]MDO9296219.1 hypothetical protein [Bradyrhizobium sp.]